MKIHESAQVFLSFLQERGIDPSAPPSMREAAAVWLEFFRDVRVSDGVPEEGGNADMLLLEWGIRPELKGYYERCFYLNLTRQFISEDGEDDDAIFQLYWQAEYEPTEDLTALGAYSEWCDTPSALHYFNERVLGSTVFPLLDGRRPFKVELVFTPV